MIPSFPTLTNKKETVVRNCIHENYIANNWYAANALPLIYNGPDSWLDSIIGHWCILPSIRWLDNITLGKPIFVYFELEEDAVSYKLTWL